MKVHNDFGLINTAYSYVMQSLGDLEPDERHPTQCFINLDVRLCKGANLSKEIASRRKNGSNQPQQHHQTIDTSVMPVEKDSKGRLKINYFQNALQTNHPGTKNNDKGM